ncbi:hypothetical protein B0O99DRAFT_680321 [Bisporella sp. PMI_857]|nr:hypothetical protein B0O99DRAFT_680321 [Bisporella sp. PMI_857]
MKLSTFLLLASAFFESQLSLAADPNDCSGTNKERDGADFLLKESANNAYLSALSTKLASRKASVSDVLNSANHALTTASLTKPIEAYMWEHTDDFNDEATTKWVPQGITSTADALGAGEYEGRSAWAVSWYNEVDNSVRVTFVDQDTKKYRHVLLVVPTASDNYAAVPVHAGGIVWYGNTLWVVDSNGDDAGGVGFRVFDLTNIWTMDSGGDDIMGKSGSNYYAMGYKYVIPQIRYYTWTPSFNFRFSFVSLDRTDTPDSLLVGEYQTASYTGPRRFVKWDLDYTTRKLKTTSGIATATWAYCVDIDRMQGAVSANGKFYISRSNGADAGDLWGWVPGSAAHNNAGFLPTSPEDLSFDSVNNIFYTLTEAVNKRYILAYRASQVTF